MTNNKQLEALYWLRELKSYAKVAEHIHVTQPAISARISALEEQIGQKLVTRNGRTVSLTRIGLEIADHAELVISAQQALLDKIRRSERSMLSIGLVGLVVHSWCGEFRKQLKKMHPDLLVEFTIGSNVQLEKRMEAGEIDIAFVSNTAQPRPGDDDFALLYDIGWVASPEAAEHLEVPVSLRDIARQELVMYPPTSPLHSPVRSLIKHHAPIEGVRHYANSLSAMINLLKFGFGFSAIPLVAAQQEIEQGELCVIETLTPMEPMALQCVCLPRIDPQIVTSIQSIALSAAKAYIASGGKYLKTLTT